jgi:hypothetical protein
MATTATLMKRVLLTTTTNTSLYTAPATGTAIVTNVAIANSTATAATATLNLPDPTGNAIPILSAVSIPANTTAFFDIKQTVPANYSITGGAGTSSALYIHISGVVII